MRQGTSDVHTLVHTFSHFSTEKCEFSKFAPEMQNSYICHTFEILQNSHWFHTFQTKNVKVSVFKRHNKKCDGKCERPTCEISKCDRKCDPPTCEISKCDRKCESPPHVWNFKVRQKVWPPTCSKCNPPLLKCAIPCANLSRWRTKLCSENRANSEKAQAQLLNSLYASSPARPVLGIVRVSGSGVTKHYFIEAIQR